MAKKLFVGNLPYSISEDEVKAFFSEVGTVDSVKIITDQYSGRSKGFGFVEMANDEEADKAIETLNGKELQERALIVNEARPMTERKPGAFRTGRREGSDRGRNDY